MERTITIKAVGKASQKPDCIRLNIELEAKELEYQKTMDLKNRLGHGEFALMPTGAHASTITETERVNQQILQNLIGAKT